MEIKPKKVFSISDANQNFLNIIKFVDKNGKAVIVKNNKTKYVIVNMTTFLS